MISKLCTPPQLASQLRLRLNLGPMAGDIGYVWNYYETILCSHYCCFVVLQTNRRRVRGIRHVDDLAYLTGFVQPLAYMLDFRGNISEENLQLSRHFRQLIVNFVKNG